MSRMTGNLSSPGRRAGSLMFVIPLLCAWQTPVGFADNVKVYECRGRDGAVEYRQLPCDQGLQREVRVDTTPSGWVPPRVKPESKRAGRVGKSRSRAASGRASRTAQLKQKQEKECWRVKQRLDKLEWRMRRGYKAGKGPGLRRQRREYEEYIRTFC